jgi:dipeptidyl aminopeptidase/acylaminoacyl peptidase
MFVKYKGLLIAKMLSVALFPNVLVAQTSSTPRVGSVDQSIDQYLWSFSKNKVVPNQKSLIDFKAIENWSGLSGYLSVSDDGNYFAYMMNKPSGDRYWWRSDDSLIVQSTHGNWRLGFAALKPGFFAADGKQYIFQNDRAIYFLRFDTKQLTTLKDVSYAKTNKKNSWLAYQVDGKDSLLLQNLETGKETLFDNITEFDFDNNGDWLVCKTRTSQLLLYNVTSRTKKIFDNAINYAFSATGNSLLVKTNEYLQYINLQEGEAKDIWVIKEKMGIGSYSFDADGRKVVFTIIDSANAANNSVGFYRAAAEKAVEKITTKTAGIPDGLIITDASFTDNGHYVQLSLQSKPEIVKPDEHKAAVEVWNHKDLNLQSAQSNQLNNVANYKGIINIATGETSFMESNERTLVQLKGDFALVKRDNAKESGDRFWERKNGDSLWVVSLKDGCNHLLPTQTTSYWFSLSGNYLLYFDGDKGYKYFSYSLNTQVVREISANVPENRLGIINRENGQISKEGSVSAWVENEGVLVYDNYDIWKMDLTGKRKAVNITNGFGQINEIVFNLFTTARSSYDIRPELKVNGEIILRAFNWKNKQQGFYKKASLEAGVPSLLYMGNYFVNEITEIYDGNVASNNGTAPVKAKKANSWIVQRQSTNDAPNYYETSDFKSFRRLTKYQPQKNYLWFTEEVVSYQYLDGQVGQGILYKPENFDPNKRYPVLIPFYGAFANNMFQFPRPSYIDQAMETGKSPIWMLNNGYLVFTPDIAVTPSKYGPKSYSVIEGAVQYLKTLPYVDANKLGIASHSWGAKLAAYNLTHSTSISAAAITEGFLYGNMIDVALSLSGAGSSMEEIEDGEYCYGNLWKNKDRWLDQTTVLNVDKAVSPLLLLCNKESSPQYQNQTFQIFNALRRLDKNVWWLKYDNGDHTLHDLKELKDYTIRYTQFFDHYLKYAPAPRWMTQGVPLKLKGIESRYELDPDGKCNAANGEACLICEAWNKQYQRRPDMFNKEIKEWVLDNDVAEELNQIINKRRKLLDKQGEIQTKEVLQILNSKE